MPAPSITETGRAAVKQASYEWLRQSWNALYPYSFSWLGAPIFQQPDDILRIQDVIVQQRPDVIIETGIGRGGGLLFYASLCQLLGHGRVIGVELKPNRLALDGFPHITERIEIIEGDSVATDTVKTVQNRVKPGENCFIILDSWHARDHVLKELEAYAPLIQPSGWLAVAETSFEHLHDLPNGKAKWADNHPLQGIEIFLTQHPEFEQVTPAWTFNTSLLAPEDVASHFSGGWLRRREKIPNAETLASFQEKKDGKV